MPNVSGYVYYSANSTLVTTAGIPNVPVALFDAVNGIGAVAYTDPTGFYQFTGVPNGAYRLIESWTTVGAPTPIAWSSATPMAQPVEKEPPITALSVAPPPLAVFLNAITPNLLNITVNGADLVDQNFIDAPVGDKPLTLNGVTMVGPNLITVADNGTMGTIAGGSVVNSIPAVAPYPGVTPGFAYSTTANPPDGSYNVTNTRREIVGFPWYNVSDHTSKIETGRFMTVNGANPKSVIFTQDVTVTPNTQYAFTGWVLNLLTQNLVDPKLSFKVVASDGTVLGYEILNSIAETPIPVWVQNGFIFNSGAYSSITVEILSEGPFASGNDFLIDDVTLYAIAIENLLKVEKKASPDIVYSTKGTDVTITVTVTNTSTILAPNVFFQDILDPSIVFNTGSITVNGSGIGYETADPNLGFSLGNMAPGDVKVIVFHATTQADGTSPIKNNANATYDMATTAGGDVITNTVTSNSVYIRLLKFDFSQASTDLVESIALEQTALSHILNAEGEKIQAAVANPDITIDQLLLINASVESMVDTISALEMMLSTKAKLVKNQVVGYHNG